MRFWTISLLALALLCSYAAVRLANMQPERALKLRAVPHEQFRD